MAAAWTADRCALTVAVINPTESEEVLDLPVTGADLASEGTLWRMVPDGRHRVFRSPSSATAPPARVSSRMVLAP